MAHKLVNWFNFEMASEFSFRQFFTKCQKSPTWAQNSNGFSLVIWSDSKDWWYSEDSSQVITWIPDSMGVRYSNGSHMTWQTIWILDILDHNQALSVWFSDHHLNIELFDNQTQNYHLNTQLVWYSDPHLVFRYIVL